MQTIFAENPTVAYPGMDADSGLKDDRTVIVDETIGIEPGLAVMRGTSGDRTARLPPAFAADDDAIIPAHATAAADLTLDTSAAGELDGTIGIGRIFPPSRLELVVSAHANVDLTNWPLVFEDEHGVRKTYYFPVPDGGGVTLRTPDFVSRVISLFQPTQSGIGGSFKLGTTTDRAIGLRDLQGICVRTHKTRQDMSASNNEVYEDESEALARRFGRIYAAIENAFSAGDALFVRCTAAGAEKRGAFRVGDSDGGDCALVTVGMRLRNSGGAAGYGVIEVNL